MPVTEFHIFLVLLVLCMEQICRNIISQFRVVTAHTKWLQFIGHMGTSCNYKCRHKLH